MVVDLRLHNAATSAVAVVVAVAAAAAAVLSCCATFPFVVRNISFCFSLPLSEEKNIYVFFTFQLFGILFAVICL